MAQYKVIEEIDIPAVDAVEAVEASEGVEAVAAVEAKEAIKHSVGDLIELTDEQAEELTGKVEKVEAPAPTPTPTPATPAEPTIPPAPADEKPTSETKEEGWAGNHKV